MQKVVSVITITYNSSKYIRQAIESVLAQSFTDFEYIISDDCSADNTWEIIKEYSDPRIRSWRNEQNIGEYPNRNKTLQLASGEYVIWLDGDDILYPHGLEFMVRMLRAFPDSAMLSSRPYSDFLVYPIELSPKQIFQLELLGSPVLVNGFPDTLFRTKILKEIGGFSSKYISGDTYAKRLISLKYNSVFVSSGLSWWRKTENQASKKLDSPEGFVQTVNMQIEFIERSKAILSENQIARAQHRLFSGISRYLFIKYAIKFRFGKVIRIIRQLSNPFLILRYLLANRPPEYKLASSDNPLRLDFQMNPYSSHENI